MLAALNRESPNRTFGDDKFGFASAWCWPPGPPCPPLLALAVGHTLIVGRVAPGPACSAAADAPFAEPPVAALAAAALESDAYFQESLF
jgi:hypothetical protein